MTFQQKYRPWPDVTYHAYGVSSGLALFVLRPIHEALCLNGLDGHAVTANVAIADISVQGPD